MNKFIEVQGIRYNTNNIVDYMPVDKREETLGNIEWKFYIHISTINNDKIFLFENRDKRDKALKNLDIILDVQLV